jgi:hypothetical protein
MPQICHGWLSRHRQILDKLIFINGAGIFKAYSDDARFASVVDRVRATLWR